MKFQLFIHNSVKILIFIYLMNKQYFYTNIQSREARRPIGALTDASYGSAFLGGHFNI